MKRKLKEKRAPGRPRLTYSQGYCSEQDFFEAVRKQFTPKELGIFSLSRAHVIALSEDCLEPMGRYRNGARWVKGVVDKVKASIISVNYIQACLGMDKNQYYQFIRYIKLDAAGEESILLAKGYALARYYCERYNVLDGEPVKKSGMTDRGLTFEQFEDLVKIAVWDREALQNKFQASKKRPKRISLRGKF